MKLAIIELHGHLECLNSFCKIFEHSSFQIDIYTIPRIYNELQHYSYSRQFRWNVKPQNMSIKKFLTVSKTALNNYDILFFTTMEIETGYSPYTGIGQKPATVLRVHNINSWFNRLHNIRLYFTPHDLFKDFSYLIRVFFGKADWLHKAQILRSISFFTFPTNQMTQFAATNQLVKSEKLIAPIPVSVFDPEYYKPPEKERITFTIPGKVDKRRRDYYLILRVLENVLKKSNKSIKLIFLGKATSNYAKDVIKQFKKLSVDYSTFKFQYFTARVPQAQFDDIIKKTDLFLSPINIQTKYKLYREIYGQTKLSGIESDIIRYGKPAILPKAYQVDEDIQGLIDFYSNEEELSAILKEYIHTDLLSRKISMAKNILENYSPEKLLPNIERIFLNLINQ